MEQGLRRRIQICMILIYFMITAIWAFGSNNYGTALRHQMLSDWLLILLGMPILMMQIEKLKNITLWLKK